MVLMLAGTGWALALAPNTKTSAVSRSALAPRRSDAARRSSLADFIGFPLISCTVTVARARVAPFGPYLTHRAPWYVGPCYLTGIL